MVIHQKAKNILYGVLQINLYFNKKKDFDILL